jgi:adenine specific DNA methylase Mod
MCILLQLILYSLSNRNQIKTTIETETSFYIKVKLDELMSKITEIGNSDGKKVNLSPSKDKIVMKRENAWSPHTPEV